MQYPFQNKRILKILNKYQSIWSLSYLYNLAIWDTETYMPKNGANTKSIVLGKASAIQHNLFLEKEFANLIHEAEDETNLNDSEKAVVRILSRQLKVFEKIPVELTEEFNELVGKSTLVWSEARKKNDYMLFEPYLEKIVSITKAKIDHLGYEKHPYDAVIDIYEEGWTCEMLDKIFNQVKPFTKEVLNKVLARNGSENIRGIARETNYSEMAMRELNKETLKYIYPDQNSVRLDESMHPFTTPLGIKDSRITTRYTNSFSSWYSTIHEFGHALYGMQIDHDLEFTPLWLDLSTSMHESQSRFWENHVGRSKSFIDKFYKLIIKLNDNFEVHSSEDFYRFMTMVSPSPIRVDADEITYHLHIIIRYELEKQLLSNELSVKDLPEAWNNLYNQYLGIVPTTRSNGVLQDIHWSDGYLGYFPTYSLGSILSATFAETMESDTGKSLDDLSNAAEGVAKIREWLATKIHKTGSTYTMKQIVERVTGKELSLEPWKNYITKKYVQV